MSAAQVISLAALHDETANAVAAPQSTPAVDRPRPAGDLPYRLIAIQDIRVAFGVMNGETMEMAEDLVEGDCWSFHQVSNMVPADTRLDGDNLWINLSVDVDLGPTSLLAAEVLDLTLMSEDADLLQCRHIQGRGPVGNGRSFLLVPAAFDSTKPYELIRKAG